MFCFKRMSSRELGWTPWALRVSALGGFIFLDVTIIVTLVTLAIITSSRDGFIMIGDQSQRFWIVSWNMEFLWTSLPVLVFRLLAIYLDWITSSISQRQPYVDLLKDGGAPARKTILLDYLSIPVLWRWWKAFANNHSVVGSCSLLTLIMSILISALAANLFVVKTVPVTTTREMLVSTGFNDSAMNLTINWVPVFDTVSATLIHNGSPIAWTDKQYAFQPYDFQDKSEISTEVVTKLNAYSADLSCSVLSDFRLDMQDLNLFIEANDRGCTMSHQFEVSERQEVYLEMLSINDCPAEFSRLVVVAAMYSSASSTLVTNLTVMSCIPRYSVTFGALLADVRGDSVVVRHFTPDLASDIRPIYWRTFEEDILASETYNYKTVWSTSAFGNVILYNAQARDSTSYLAPEVLQKAVEQTFTAVYLTAAAKHAFIPLEAPLLISGTSVSFVQRLHSVNWTTYLIITILLIDLFAVLMATYYVYSHASILEKEPAGLLAYATILEQSPLLQVGHYTRSGEKQGLVDSTDGIDLSHDKRPVQDTTEKGDHLSETVALGLKDTDLWGAIVRPEGNGWMITRLR